jgi:hypothetical protein
MLAVKFRIALLLCFLALPTLFSAQEKASIRTLRLSDFQMPDSVREQFQSSGCSVIAQSNLISEPNNLLHGQFAAPGQQDWMAVCKNVDGRVQARFIWGGQHRCESPLADDLLLHLVMSRIEIPIVPYLQAAPSRKAQDHERLLERWSVSGVWSYYCKDGQWDRSPGDTCRKNSVEEHPPAKNELSANELAVRRDIRGVARDELRKAMAPLSSTLEISALDGRCLPASSLVQNCYFHSVGDESLDATVTVEQAGDAWFATRANATVCHLQ